MRTNRPALATLALIGCAVLVLAQDKKPDAKSAPAAKKPGPITAVVGAEIHTVTKRVVKNGVILIQDGKILKVGEGLAVPEGATVIDAKGKVVTPGFVAISASNVALRGAGGGPGGGGPPAPGGQGGVTGRVADALNPFDRNILFCLATGITTACVETNPTGGGRFGRDGDDPIPDDTSVCPCCGMTFLPTEPIGPVQPAERVARKHAVLKMTYGDMGPMLVKETTFYSVPAGSFVGALNRHTWRETIKRAKQQLKDQAGADFDDPGFGPPGGGMRGGAVSNDVLRLVEKKIP